MTLQTAAIMPELKLVYFNARGRAELARWILAYGDMAYTDERIEKKDWPERKKSEFLFPCFLSLLST